MVLFIPLTAAFSILLLPIALYTTIRFVLSTFRPKNYPPGPPPLPILGNIHQIPRLYSHLTLSRWSQQYGPITGLKFGPLNIVILNSAPLVYELLVKRAASFNERHPPYNAKTHILPEGRDTYTLFMTQEWSTRLRTLTKNTLVGGGLSNLVPLQKAGGMRLVWRLFASGKGSGGGAGWEECLKPWYVLSNYLSISNYPQIYLNWKRRGENWTNGNF